MLVMLPDVVRAALVEAEARGVVVGVLGRIALGQLLAHEARVAVVGIDGPVASGGAGLDHIALPVDVAGAGHAAGAHFLGSGSGEVVVVALAARAHLVLHATETVVGIGECSGGRQAGVGNALDLAGQRIGERRAQAQGVGEGGEVRVAVVAKANGTRAVTDLGNAPIGVGECERAPEAVGHLGEVVARVGELGLHAAGLGIGLRLPGRVELQDRAMEELVGVGAVGILRELDGFAGRRVVVPLPSAA